MPRAGTSSSRRLMLAWLGASSGVRACMARSAGSARPRVRMREIIVCVLVPCTPLRRACRPREPPSEPRVDQSPRAAFHRSLRV